jgi:hypothetical protein
MRDARNGRAGGIAGEMRIEGETESRRWRARRAAKTRHLLNLFDRSPVKLSSDAGARREAFVPDPTDLDWLALSRTRFIRSE